MIFFVTQGQAYDFEARDGYIWAPCPSSKNQVNRFFWENVALVKAGDIIIHYAGSIKGGISAISQALTDAYNSPITSDLIQITKKKIKGVADWGSDGKRVDCNYITLKNKIPIKIFKNDILKFKSERYSAFNKNGGVCQGYLYELEKPLAARFTKKAVELNPYLSNYNFIMGTLKILKTEL